MASVQRSPRARSSSPCRLILLSEGPAVRTLWSLVLSQNQIQALLHAALGEAPEHGFISVSDVGPERLFCTLYDNDSDTNPTSPKRRLLSGQRFSTTCSNRKDNQLKAIDPPDAEGDTYQPAIPSIRCLGGWHISPNKTGNVL